MMCYRPELGEGPGFVPFVDLAGTVLHIVSASRATSVEDYRETKHIAAGLAVKAMAVALPVAVGSAIFCDTFLPGPR